MTEPVFVGVDIGGTKVLAGMVGVDGLLVRRAHRDTPGRSASVAHIDDVLTETVMEAADGAAITGIGIGAAGFVDERGERVLFAPHLPWRDDPLRARLEARWGIPVTLDNDANCAARAELEHGSARDARSALVITVGTGIGGALILDGRVFRGAGGMAGEFGHMTVQPDGLPCQCGGSGCWEQYASGNALLRRARTLLGTQPSCLDQLCQQDPDRLTGAMVTQAVERDDQLARAVFDEVGEWLGRGLANLVAAFDPEVLVVGGGVSRAGENLFEPARRALKTSVVGLGHRTLPPILQTELGAEAGVVGAALQARRAHGLQ